MNKLMRNLTFGICTIIAMTNTHARDYYLITPTTAPVEYSKLVTKTMKNLLDHLDQGDQIFIINNNSQELCSLNIVNKSIGNYMRLVRTCKGKLVIDSSDKDSFTTAPLVVNKLFEEHHVMTDSQIIIFGDPLHTSDDLFNLKTSAPSLGYLEKLGYGITRYSTYKAAKPDGVATLHILYPTSIKFASLKHQLSITNFYGCWAQKLGLRVGSFAPLEEGVNRVLDNTLIHENICESDGTESGLFMTDFTRNTEVAREKRGYKEVLYHSSTLDVTRPRYQFSLRKPAVLSQLSLTEYDGDADGSNWILVDAITNDNKVLHLGKLKPSGNNKAQTHVLAIETTKPIRDVIILPVTKEGIPDLLGGVWGIRSLSVIHKGN